MKYRIVWLQSALDELTEIWTQAPSQLRKTITKASHAIDTQLVVNPEQRGESRPKGRRVDFFPPLGVCYRVDVQDGIVAVVHVWCFRQHAK
jgi:plasmid stabilization system protein ParE